MLQSSADNVPRSLKPEERLFPLWKLIGLGLSALAVLWMLYANQKIMQQVAAVEDPDDVSVFFLNNIHANHPADESWRFLLAQHQLELGALKDAQETIGPLLTMSDPMVQKTAGLIDLQIMEMQIVAATHNEQGRRRLKSAMIERIRDLLHHLTTPQDLSSLAASALLAEDWQLATHVYRQLAQVDANNQVAWFRKGAKLALGQKSYIQASELFFLARTKSQLFEENRKDYISGLKALIAGNELKAALMQAEKYLGTLERDETTLKFLVKLGRTAGNGVFTQKYVDKLLHVSHARSRNIYVTFKHFNSILSANISHRRQDPNEEIRTTEEYPKRNQPCFRMARPSGHFYLVV